MASYTGPSGYNSNNPTEKPATPQATCTDQYTSSAASIATAFSYGILILPTVIGNGLVVIAFLINAKLRTATNIFIFGLALSDLLIGSFSLPLWAYITSFDSLSVGYCMSLYQPYICVDIFAGCASILQLTAIAIERLFFTVAPLRHRNLSRTVYYIIAVTVWLLSLVIAGLQPVQSRTWEQEYSLFVLVTCFIIPLIVIICVYAYIFKVGRYQARPRRSSRQSVGSTGGCIKEFNIFVTVITFTGLFIITWMPFFVVTAIASFCLACLPPHPQISHIVKFVKWMQYSSSSVNPYIYACRNAELKSTLRRIIRSILCGYPKPGTSFNANSYCYRNDRKSNSGDDLGLRENSNKTGKVNTCYTSDEVFRTSQTMDYPDQRRQDMLSFEECASRSERFPSGQDPSGLFCNGESVVNFGPRENRISLESRQRKDFRLDNGAVINKHVRTIAQEKVGLDTRQDRLRPRREGEVERCGTSFNEVDLRKQRQHLNRPQHQLDVQNERARSQSVVCNPIKDFDKGGNNSRQFEGAPRRTQEDQETRRLCPSTRRESSMANFRERKHLQNPVCEGFIRNIPRVVDRTVYEKTPVRDVSQVRGHYQMDDHTRQVTPSPRDDPDENASYV